MSGQAVISITIGVTNFLVVWITLLFLIRTRQVLSPIGRLKLALAFAFTSGGLVYGVTKLVEVLA